jgi:hypothetical protein
MISRRYPKDMMRRFQANLFHTGSKNMKKESRGEVALMTSKCKGGDVNHLNNDNADLIFTIFTFKTP